MKKTAPVKRRIGGLNGTQLKYIAAITMLIDHITFAFMERVVSPQTGRMVATASDALYLLDRIGRIIGRQAFPIFAFFVAEGFVHTRSRGKYFLRLVLFAILSQVPFYLVSYTGPIGETRKLGLNVYATLSLGLLAIWIIEELYLRYARQDAAVCPQWELALRLFLSLLITALICLVSYKLNTDYDYKGVIAIVLFFMLRFQPKIGVIAVWVWLGCTGSMEWFALPGCLALLLYNGKRGGDTHPVFTKYFFYIFYPAHLLILWLIRMYLFGY